MNYDELLELIEYNLPLILGVILSLFLVLMILSISLLISTRKLKYRYNLLMKGADKESLQDMIKQYQEVRLL